MKPTIKIRLIIADDFEQLGGFLLQKVCGNRNSDDGEVGFNTFFLLREGSRIC